MDQLFDQVCAKCSELITKEYSTSFSMGIRVFDKKYRAPIYGIYGFVRFADEIVDTYKGADVLKVLQLFREDTFKAIENGVSFNPVLHAFQQVVNKYEIDHHLIEAFLDSMEMDIYLNNHDLASYQKYIYGSAEVVGLMCLHIFLEDDKTRYKELVPAARALGSAFQKVNFLRDLKSDYKDRGRVYFPDVDFENFSTEDKMKIEQDIQSEFNLAYQGILQLPKGVRFGVYCAYKYYLSLFYKIVNTPATHIMQARVRIPNRKKLYLLTESAFKTSLNML
ncbi:MAG: phytoene/squalene synthase family protein [Saprospiraceae bacterium]|nr:phytoene/squalene synthase family protein [Saprospiraceae bacterium]